MDERRRRPRLPEFFLPGWENHARSEYEPPLYPDTETNFTRGNRSMQILDEYGILSQTGTPSSLLFVGLGLDAYPLECCYQPFRLAARFDAENYRYRMDCIDISASVIKDIRERKKLYLHRERNEGLPQTQSWEMYLNDTDQDERVIHKPEEGLLFHEGITNNSIVTKRDYLANGISAAKIPKNFSKNVDRGNITLQTADIATTYLPQQQYRFVELLNVLYQLPPAGQKLALRNVASAMRSGAILLVNDIGPSGIPLLKRLGGWLDESNLHNFNLKLQKRLYFTNTSETFILQKK